MAISINHFLNTYFFGAVETHRTYILFYTAMYFLLLYISMISLSYIHLCLLMYANIHYKRVDRKVDMI